jgi:ribonuclease P protein component
MVALARKITQFSKQEIDQLWEKVHPVLKHDGFLLLRAPRQGAIGRILIIISKKIGNAPTRNTLRRQIKAIFYENDIFNKTYDWIMVTKKPITNLTFQELKQLLLPALSTP